MTTIAGTPVDVTEHVFRSLRGWLHRLFPTADIFIQRDESEEPTRPAFRLELAAGPHTEEAAAGFNWALMSVIVHYAAATGEAVTYDVMRTVGKIRANAVRPMGRIPMNLYNFEWPQPPEITKDADVGGTLPEALNIAVAAIGADGAASAPSEPVALTIPDGATVGVRPRNWPTGEPLAVSWEIYAGTDAVLHLQGTVDDLDTFVLTDYTPAGAAPPSNRRLPWKGLRVDSIDVATVEGAGSERIMDAAVTLRLRALAPITTPAQMDAALS